MGKDGGVDGKQVALLHVSVHIERPHSGSAVGHILPLYGRKYVPVLHPAEVPLPPPRFPTQLGWADSRLRRCSNHADCSDEPRVVNRSLSHA